MSVSVSSQRVGRLEFWLKHLIAYVSGTADSVDNSVTLRETFLVSVCLVQILCKNESPTFHSLELLLRSLFIFWLVLSNNGLYGNSLVHRHSGRQPYLLLFRNIPWETLFCPFFFCKKHQLCSLSSLYWFSTKCWTKSSCEFCIVGSICETEGTQWRKHTLVCHVWMINNAKFNRSSKEPCGAKMAA